MQFKFYAPGKTFILGEYIALEGEPTLIACTSPQFEARLSFKRSDQAPKNIAHVQGISSLSPAGQLLLSKEVWLRSKGLTIDFAFSDPYSGKGGLGASTAQFLFLYLFIEFLERAFKDVGSEPVSARVYEERVCAEAERLSYLRSDFSFSSKMLRDYRQLADQGGIPPSGADLMAQLSGQITQFHKNENILKSLMWPFADIDFFLVRTGTKVATHNHLKSTPVFPAQRLKALSNDGLRAYLNGQPERFAESVEAYGQCLEDAGLTLKESSGHLKDLRESQLTLAQKGCGALGADFIFVLFKAENRERLITFLRSKGMEIEASKTNLVPGVSVLFERSI